MPSSTRTRLGRLLLLVSASAVLAACGDAAASPEDSAAQGFTLRVGLTSVNGTVQGNIGWGDEKGLLLDALRPAGVEKIDFALFQSGKDVTAALLSGAVDVAVTGDNPALTARSNGAETRLLALSTISGDTWLIGRPDGPTDIKDLVGKTVAAPEGTIRDRVAHGLLQAAGIGDKVPVRNVATPEALAGLAGGSIDATTVGGTTAIELERQGYVVIDKASEHGLESTEPNTALQSFLDEHPDFAKAWAAAVVSVNEHVRDHGADYWAYSADKDEVEVDVAKEAEPLENFPLEPLPAEGLKQLTSTYQYLLDTDSLEGPFDIEKWVVEP
jgi:sulfonate transport system substrate-binding protein